MANFNNINELKEEIKNIKTGKVLKFKIMVNASAKTNTIEFQEEYIKIRIKERAVEGKANKAIIEFLSEILDIPKKRVEITSGATSRIKTVCIK